MDKQDSIKSKAKLPPIPVGNYNVELSRVLGRGSYGIVYRAKHQTTDQICAVKNITFPDDDAVKLSKMEESAQREWSILRGLDHENIVKYHDITIFSASWWIFLEFCDLGNLAQYLDKTVGISEDLKTAIEVQCAEAVKYIHSQDIIHRDLKLENYLLKSVHDRSLVKLSDFEMSKVVEKTHSEQTMTANKGTMLYRSPEQFRGDKYSHKVDIFSLGLVLLVVSEFSEKNRNTFPQSVEAQTRRQRACIGMEMNERKIVTLVEFNQDDSMQVRHLKELIIDMTRKDPTKRIGIGEVCVRLNESSMSATSATDNNTHRAHKDDAFSRFCSTEEDSISHLFDSISSKHPESSPCSPIDVQGHCSPRDRQSVSHAEPLSLTDLDKEQNEEIARRNEENCKHLEMINASLRRQAEQFNIFLEKCAKINKKLKKKKKKNRKARKSETVMAHLNACQYQIWCHLSGNIEITWDEERQEPGRHCVFTSRARNKIDRKHKLLHLTRQTDGGPCFCSC